MHRSHLPTEADTRDVGWRLRQLRLRRGLSLASVAALAGKHTSQISRLERHRARYGEPKSSTMMELLDAIQATPAERRAVFHVEAPPISQHEIDTRVAATANEFERSKAAVGLIDDHWYRWYMNPASRVLLGLQPEEYEGLRGEHVLLHLIDPASPLYNRYPEEDRKRIFSWRVAAFQFHYADQQFDSWYLRVAQDIRRVYWAEQIWQSPPELPTFADNMVFPMIHPAEGRMLFRSQVNTILIAPRFSLSEMTAADDATAKKMERLLASIGPGSGQD
jgi:transcriptional regulator with XRE-family HTH domain